MYCSASSHDLFMIINDGLSSPAVYDDLKIAKQSSLDMPGIPVVLELDGNPNTDVIAPLFIEKIHLPLTKDEWFTLPFRDLQSHVAKHAYRNFQDLGDHPEGQAAIWHDDIIESQPTETDPEAKNRHNDAMMRATYSYFGTSQEEMDQLKEQDPQAAMMKGMQMAKWMKETFKDVVRARYDPVTNEVAITVERSDPDSDYYDPESPKPKIPPGLLEYYRSKYPGVTFHDFTARKEKGEEAPNFASVNTSKSPIKTAGAKKNDKEDSVKGFYRRTAFIQIHSLSPQADGYSCTAQLTETRKRYIVSLRVSHEMLGTSAHGSIWQTDDLKTARKIYDGMLDLIDEAQEEVLEEDYLTTNFPILLRWKLWDHYPEYRYNKGGGWNENILYLHPKQWLSDAGGDWKWNIGFYASHMLQYHPEAMKHPPAFEINKREKMDQQDIQVTGPNSRNKQYRIKHAWKEQDPMVHPVVIKAAQTSWLRRLKQLTNLWDQKNNHWRIPAMVLTGILSSQVIAKLEPETTPGYREHNTQVILDAAQQLPAPEWSQTYDIPEAESPFETQPEPPEIEPTPQPDASSLGWQKAYEDVLRNEGGYSDQKFDRGGRTMQGITEDVYREWTGDPHASVRNITQDEIQQIYKGQYWDAIHADELPPKVAYQLFDFYVNSGGWAVKRLQRIVGATEDGVIGPNTKAAINNYVQQYGEDALAKEILDARADFIGKVLQAHPEQVKFRDGWYNRLARQGSKLPGYELPDLPWIRDAQQSISKK